MLYRQFKNLNCFKKINDNLRGKKNTAVFGVCQNQKPAAVSTMDSFVLYVVGDFIQAQEVLRQLNALKGGFEYLTFRDEVLLSNKGSSASVRAQRNATLFNIKKGLNGIVTTVESLCQLYPNVKSFFDSSLILKKGMTADIFEVVQKLVAAGYRRSEQITSVGEFSRKGDILDVFCPSHENPVRIEFFGDEIDDVRIFDKLTKKSIEKTDQAQIIPLNQFFASDFDADQVKEQVFYSLSRQKLDANGENRLKTVAEDAFLALDNGDFSNSWLMPFVKTSTLCDYLPKDTVVVWDEPKQLADRLSAIYAEHFQRMAYLLSKGEVLPESVKQLVDKNAVIGLFGCFGQLAFQGVTSSNVFFASSETVNVKSSPVVGYQNKLEFLCDDINNWLVGGYSVSLFAGNAEAGERLSQTLEGFRLSAPVLQSADLSLNGLNIFCDNLLYGFVDHDDKKVFVGAYDLFPKQTAKKKVKKANDKVFTTPDIGDYVVHEVHGIGLCQGIVSMTGSFGTKDFIEVKYKNDDTLYVPVDSSNLLTKYSGSEKTPKLSKLGGDDFEKVKAKVKANLKEMAFDLLKLYAAREHARGFSYPSDGFLEEAFAKSFPYTETEDQLKCIKQINDDLTGEKIMDRLICGDVGYGKTEVALRAAFKVISAGKQVAFLSPTTILAEQHFKTASKRMEQFGVKTACLNRFRSAKEQKEILKKAESGEAELICGTHRLLSKDVKFKDLGLLILDEEQRFGVEAKESIKNLKNNVDVLTLSATPIPRTLHMALTGMRDISIIQSPPKDRLPVETYVLESTDTLLTDVITREINRGGQVFLIYNRVETIERFTAHLKELMPTFRFVIAHGQMKEGELEKNIYDFTYGNYDVLVSSAIIENGIDIPNANTLIVYDSDNFGLSQLYQLRGRVGRSNRRAFAYFMYRENKVLTDVAYKRLNSILEYTELGSGFKIAMRDLEIRGAGNVLGREQHGHMEKVGYDMYCKLLEEAVGELKGEKVKAKVDTVMDVAIDATAGSYIEDSESRMAFYQRLAEISTYEEAEELREEITDIYGAPPKQVINLISLSLLKQKASESGINEVVIRPKNICVSFENTSYLQRQEVFDALEKFKNIAKLDVTHKLSVVFQQGGESMERMFDKVADFVDLTLPKNG